MSDTTTLTVLVTTLLVIASGLAMGAAGPFATEVSDAAQGNLAAQETTQATTQAEAQATTQADSAQDNASEATTTQAGGGQGSTDVLARNVTVEHLVMQNVTVQDATVGSLTVTNETGAPVRTYQNVSLARLQVNGNVSDLTLTNVTIRDEAVASALIGETGAVRVDTRYIMDEAVLQNHTVNGLEVRNASVTQDAAENVSLPEGTAAGDTESADAGGQDGGEPAVSAEGAVLEQANLSVMDVGGLSAGEQAANETTAAAQETTAAPGGETTTAAAAEETPTAVGGQTTTGEATTTTVPAEAGNRTIEEGDEDTTTVQ